GTVSPYYDLYSLGAEGLAGQPMVVNAYGGISGYHGENAFPLVGVFVSGATPQAPPPATLDFTSAGLGRNFTTLSPALGQLFFIGDGRTDGGALQTFNAPAGATRLYVGFADAPNFNGDPGNYFDNAGSLNVTVTATPALVSDHATVTIADAPVVTVVATANAKEAGLVSGQFTVTRTGDLNGNLVVNYTVNGSSTATANTDYTALPLSVTIL